MTPRDASATRAALLRSARALFSQSTYSRVTTRAIASHAGVDATLIARYFGSKPALFREALLGADLDPPRQLEDAIYGRLEDLPASLARYALRIDPTDAFDPIACLLHSAAEPEGRALLTPLLSDTLTSPLAARLRAARQPRADADRRAHLTTALLLGVTLDRALHPDATPDADTLADLTLALHAALGLAPP
jgi:AcrR family transcriptional regulator